MSSKIELQVRSRGEFSTLVNQFSDFVKEHKGKPKRNEIIDFLATEFFKKQSHHHLLAPLPEQDFPFLQRFSQERRYASELNFFICDTCRKPCPFHEGCALFNPPVQYGSGSSVMLVHDNKACAPDNASSHFGVPRLTTDEGGKERILDQMIQVGMMEDSSINEPTKYDWAVAYGRLHTPGFEELHAKEGGGSSIRAYLKNRLSIPILDELRSMHWKLGYGEDLRPLCSQMPDFFGTLLVQAPSGDLSGLLSKVQGLFKPLHENCFSSDSRYGVGFKAEILTEVLGFPWVLIDLRGRHLDQEALRTMCICLWFRQISFCSSLVLLDPGQDLDLRYKTVDPVTLSLSSLRDLINSLNTSQ